MAREIYRSEALRHLASPEQLDRLMPLTTPRGWLALGAVGLVLAAGCVWVVWGSVPVTVQGQGVLVRPRGVAVVTAPQAGVVGRIAVSVGERVAGGQELCRLTSATGTCGDPVRSPAAARIVELSAHEGQAVAPGMELALLESPEAKLQAVVFVPIDLGYQVTPATQVRIEPSGGGASGKGGLTGSVLSAGRHPASRAAIAAALGDEWMAEVVARGGPALEVVVDLADHRPGTGGQFPELYSGTPCRAVFTVARLRPLSLVRARPGPAGP